MKNSTVQVILGKHSKHLHPDCIQVTKLRMNGKENKNLDAKISVGENGKIEVGQLHGQGLLQHILRDIFETEPKDLLVVDSVVVQLHGHGQGLLQNVFRDIFEKDLNGLRAVDTVAEDVIVAVGLILVFGGTVADGVHQKAEVLILAIGENVAGRALHARDFEVEVQHEQELLFDLFLLLLDGRKSRVTPGGEKTKFSLSLTQYLFQSEHLRLLQ